MWSSCVHLALIDNCSSMISSLNPSRDVEKHMRGSVDVVLIRTYIENP